jgi:hypothetical protein
VKEAKPKITTAAVADKAPAKPAEKPAESAAVPEKK